MKRRPEPAASGGAPPEVPADGAILQIKVWLEEISPMIWRRVLAPASITLRELHGVIQVAMGWEGIHLFQFRLRAGCFGSPELWAASPDVTLAALGLRKGVRFGYGYDLNIPWQHEVRIEDRLDPGVGKPYPLCTAGSGACPPEDCGGPGAFMQSMKIPGVNGGRILATSASERKSLPRSCRSVARVIRFLTLRRSGTARRMPSTS